MDVLWVCLGRRYILVLSALCSQGEGTTISESFGLADLLLVEKPTLTGQFANGILPFG